MASTYCPVCGHENEEYMTSCEKCGADLDQEMAQQLVRAPIKWVYVALGSLVIAILLSLFHLVPALGKYSFQFKPDVLLDKRDLSKTLDMSLSDFGLLRKFEQERDITGVKKVLNDNNIRYRNVLVSRDGATRVLWPALIFAFAGLLIGLIARRRVAMELGIAVLVGWAVQTLFWFKMAGWNAGSLFGSQLFIIKGSLLRGDYVSSIVLPAAFFFFCVALIYFVVAQATTAVATALIQRVTGQSSCLHCGEQYENVKKPIACPHCRNAIKRPVMQWAWICVVALATAWVFSMGLNYGGTKGKFYYRCQETKQGKLSPSCKQAIKDYNESVAKDKQYLAGKKRTADTPYDLFVRPKSKSRKTRRAFVMVHTPRYIGYLAFLFFLGPFLLGWRLKKGALPSAGASIPLNWAAAALTAFLFFGFAGFEGTFILALRMHMIALFFWAIAGFFGALLGYKLGSSGKQYLDDADESMA